MIKVTKGIHGVVITEYPYKIEVTLDNGAKTFVRVEDLEVCPKCGCQGVRTKELCEGGGVTCIYCPYWFCY